MPSSAPIQQVEDLVLVDKQYVALHLLIELVSDVDAACVAGAWLGPSPAHTTCIANAWDQVQNLLGDSDSFKKALHGVI